MMRLEGIRRCARLAELGARIARTETRRGTRFVPHPAFDFTPARPEFRASMPRPLDTIAALATPAGTAAIALIRISGSDTQRILREIAGTAPPPRYARHGDHRGLDGELLDDVVTTYFPGPRSYTGEDSAEISCHGSPFIAQKILEDLFARGCRPAQPGEFTQRAFLNGRLDLSQAEAVMDLIHARSERALAAAQQQLRGALTRRMSELVDRLLHVLAHVEAYIDFPDEDLPAEDRNTIDIQLQQLEFDTSRLLATSHYGELLRSGVKTVIIGNPNVGKSSLLNRLLGHDRALVSPEPGTTRDFIEEGVVLGGFQLRLIDTAGLNPSPAPLEKLGIEKTRERAATADLFLVVLDATDSAGAEAPDVASILPSNTVVVFNKADLNPKPAIPEWALPYPRVAVSALTGAGLDELSARLGQLVAAFNQQVGDDIVAVSARHAQALRDAGAALASSRAKLRSGDASELLASDLRAVLAAYGEITGRIDNEAMLDRLFATFCIGK
jgi:tRNA modification GTPase